MTLQSETLTILHCPQTEHPSQKQTQGTAQTSMVAMEIWKRKISIGEMETWTAGHIQDLKVATPHFVPRSSHHIYMHIHCKYIINYICIPDRSLGGGGGGRGGVNTISLRIQLTLWVYCTRLFCKSIGFLVHHCIDTSCVPHFSNLLNLMRIPI